MVASSKEAQEEFNWLVDRFKHIFASKPGFNNAKKYLRGLLGDAERKTGRQLASYLGDSTPYAVQQFIDRGTYSADDLRDELRNYIIEKFGENDGILIINEIGFLKQGKRSCGVARQANENTRQIDNCQIGIFLNYKGKNGYGPIDRRLYIPEEWFADPGRCAKAKVPEDITYQTRPQMALDMIKNAAQADVPYNWVAGSCLYGDNKDIKKWLELNRKCYVFRISRKAYVLRENGEQVLVSDIIRNIAGEGSFKANCGDGPGDMRLCEWLIPQIDPGSASGFERSMMIRRSKSHSDKIQAFICFAPVDTPKKKLIEIASSRWVTETWLKELKQEVGMDQYEIRSYNGWYNHITFSCIALAFLKVLSCKGFK